MNHDPVKQAWQSSVEIGGAPPLDEVRKGADKFYRFIKWRNLVEYAACAISVVVFTGYVFWLPHLLQKIGSVLIVLAAVWAGWQLHRRASAVAPETAGTMPLLDFSRAQMVRQRDALRGLLWWYVAPFGPGIVLMLLGSNSAEAGETTAILIPGKAEAIFGAMMAAIVGFIVWINRRFANKLQRHIDEIDALKGAAE